MQILSQVQRLQRVLGQARYIKTIKAEQKQREQPVQLVKSVKSVPLIQVSKENEMSASDIEGLIAFGFSIFSQTFSLFKHPTTPVPTSAAPEIVQTLSATPGLTDDHKAVIASAVTAAAVVSDANPVTPVPVVPPTA